MSSPKVVHSGQVVTETSSPGTPDVSDTRRVYLWGRVSTTRQNVCPNSNHPPSHDPTVHGPHLTKLNPRFLFFVCTSVRKRVSRADLCTPFVFRVFWMQGRRVDPNTIVARHSSLHRVHRDYPRQYSWNLSRNLCDWRSNPGSEVTERWKKNDFGRVRRDRRITEDTRGDINVRCH